MNALLKNMKPNLIHTENGALAHKTTSSAVLDLFAMGAACRERTDDDIILMFKKAFEENEELAMKCLFYIRDVRGGQGERRFFRTIMRYLAVHHRDAVLRNIGNFSIYGRWDDLYCLVDTPCEKAAFDLIRSKLQDDLAGKYPVSLLGKWLKSENASSKETKRLAQKTRIALDLTPRQYRKMLSELREKIRIVETLMSQNRWDEIEFDKLPSKAGFQYKDAFWRNEITHDRYKEFLANQNTKVHADAMFPYEIVKSAVDLMQPWWGSKPNIPLDNPRRLAINKYWDSVKDYFNGSRLNALCMVDTSGSMFGTPINVAISLGLYCAKKCNGPFKNTYISFSRTPELVEIEGVDFCDEVYRIASTNICENTNIEAAFDLILDTMKENHLPQSDLPEYIIVISDMEFDAARGANVWNGRTVSSQETLMEGVRKKYAYYGYEMPKLVYWNVSARQNNIPDLCGKDISFVSGMSPSIFKTIASGQTGYELMIETICSDRYSPVH